MKIGLVGGGSGGHLTPLVAVSDALKKHDPSITVEHIGQRGEHLGDVIKHSSIDGTHEISAGKFRRYHGESFVQHLFDIRTLLLNVRDFFRFIAGFFQSFILLGKMKPDVLLLKGGYVCVPVGFAARLRKIPYVTHDSDAIPGLANRLTASHARFNAVAMPESGYPYPEQRTRRVGVPLQSAFKKVTRADMKKYRKEIGVPADATVLFCVGGGLGAQALNDALVRTAPGLLNHYDKLHIVHITGKKLYEDVLQAYHRVVADDASVQSRLHVIDFTTNIVAYSGSADLVITRAGATNLAELALQAKPCIVIPGAHLTGGQQIHNARVLQEAEAAVILPEDRLLELESTVHQLLDMPQLRDNYAQKLHRLSDDKAAERLAKLVVEAAGQQ